MLCLLRCLSVLILRLWKPAFEANSQRTKDGKRARNPPQTAGTTARTAEVLRPRPLLEAIEDRLGAFPRSTTIVTPREDGSSSPS